MGRRGASTMGGAAFPGPGILTRTASRVARRSGRTSRASGARPRGHHGVVTIRVVLADDHPVVRGGLRALLSTIEGIEVVGEAEDGEGAVREVQLRAARRAARRHPDARARRRRGHPPGARGRAGHRRAGADHVRRRRHRLHRDAGRRPGLPPQGRRPGRDRRRDPCRRGRAGDLRARHRLPRAGLLRRTAGAAGARRRAVPGADRPRAGHPRPCWPTDAGPPRSPASSTSRPRR